MDQGAFRASVPSFFPSCFFLLFFENFLGFSWGAQDPLALALAKRTFLLLPVGAVILCLWVSVLCLLTVIVRQRRVEFLKAFFVTWWDLTRKASSLFGAGFLSSCWSSPGPFMGFAE